MHYKRILNSALALIQKNIIHQFQEYKMQKIIILIITTFLAYVSVYSQSKNLNDNFSNLIRQSVGDLNKDGLLDKAIISMDTVNPTKTSKTANLLFSTKRNV